jgi:uroporphyrin-3 C-methyltransferase
VPPSRLADPERHGAQGLRLDEVELLLGQAEQRLAIASDLQGARRAYALAAAALEGIDDPAYLNLRQALVQERAALDAAGEGSHVKLNLALQGLSEALPQLPERNDPSAPQPPWWQRALAPLIQIRPSHRNVLVARSERIAGLDSLQIEISLARAAVERNDQQAYQLALQRVDAWLQRLWPDSPQLQQRRATLAELAKTPLRTPIPELGSTLRQLQSMREGRTQP